MGITRFRGNNPITIKFGTSFTSVGGWCPLFFYSRFYRNLKKCLKKLELIYFIIIFAIEGGGEVIYYII